MLKIEFKNKAFKHVFFKACVCYFFIKFLFFHQMIALQKLKKCFLFHLKSSFCSRNIQIFVIFPFLHFPDLFFFLFLYSLFKVDKFTIKTDIILYTSKNSYVLIVKIPIIKLPIIKHFET